MSAAGTIRAAIGSGDRLVPGTISQAEADALAALDELEAELARKTEALRGTALASRLVAAQERVIELEAELERLTVGRATLEDQTNRAELAEAQRDLLLERVNGYLLAQNSAGYDDGESTRHKRVKLCRVVYELNAARAVLSGGSE